MYKFKTKPFEHQKEAFQESWDKPSFALFMEMGTGKSKVVVDTMGALFMEKKIESCLIFAPKGVFDNWVEREIPIHIDDSIKKSVIRWQPNITVGFKKQFDTFVKLGKDTLKIFVMNIESLSTTKGAATAFWFCKRFKDNLVVVDESTTIKNRKANRTKAVLKLGNDCKYKRILTGSPVTKSPMDLYSQIGFLGDYLNFKSYFAFQARYAIIRRRTHANRSFQEVLGYQRLDELNEKISHISKRVLKKDCLDLPEKIYMRRNVTLTKKQRELYEQMRRLALAQVDSGALSTTNNALTQIMRLQQICSGFIKDDDGEITYLENNRIDELIKVCEETTGKVIIWATFIHDIEKICEQLSKQYGALSYGAFFGGTSTKDRTKIIDTFQDKHSKMRFFVGQSRTGGMGITLHEAQTVIYYSNNYDLSVRLQSEDRAHRIGQKKNVTYIDMIAPNTIDEKILTALQNKQNIASTVLGEELREWFL